MKTRVLSVLAALALIMAMIVPFATPVLAGSPPVLNALNVIPAGIENSPSISGVVQGVSSLNDVGGVDQTYDVIFNGTDLSGATAVKFYTWASGSQVEVTEVTCDTLTLITSTSFHAKIHVPNSAAHRPLDIAVTTSGGGEGPLLYSGFVVGDFPHSVNPTSSSGWTPTLTPCLNEAGDPILGAVYDGQQIWYKVSLAQADPDVLNFSAGQLSVRFPSYGKPTDLSSHLVAGYGALTPGFSGFPSARDIPELNPSYSGPSHKFFAMCIDPYTASKDDLDNGFLKAYADYGHTAENPSQTSGVVEGDAPLPLSGTAPSSLPMKGSLEVTKAIDLNGAVGSGLSQDFAVSVTGTGGPYTHTFRVTNGVLLNTTGYENPWLVDNLTAGSYTVTETSPGVNWAVAYSKADGLVGVVSGETDNITITNTLKPGDLEVTKVVDWNGATGTEGISKDFFITVTGAGGPYHHTFRVSNGVLQDITGYENPWVLDNLTPGGYNVSETTPGAGWSASGGGGVTVVHDNTTYTTIHNDYISNPHTTLQKPIGISPRVLPQGGGLVTVTLIDENDGNVAIPSPYFELTIFHEDTNTTEVATLSTPDWSSDDNVTTMNPGATWRFSYQVFCTGAATFTAVGYGMVGNTPVPTADETGDGRITTFHVPAVSTLGLGILILGLGGAMAYVVIRRKRQSRT
jgi:hypothetical protein